MQTRDAVHGEADELAQAMRENKARDWREHLHRRITATAHLLDAPVGTQIDRDQFSGCSIAAEQLGMQGEAFFSQAGAQNVEELGQEYTASLERCSCMLAHPVSLQTWRRFNRKFLGGDRAYMNEVLAGKTDRAVFEQHQACSH
jgi:hypothetical protein